MKKTFTARALVCVLLAAVTLFALGACGKQPETAQSRVYGSTATGVTLKTDATFTANLYHGVVKAGTYTESTDTAGDTTITFTADGTTYTGTITNGILTIPQEWADAHGHGNTFALQK